MNRVITVNMDDKCRECGKGGAMPCGLCLRCITKAIGGKAMMSEEGRTMRVRFYKSRERGELCKEE